MAAKIKKGDKVVVLTGKYKGQTGEVTKSFPEENRVLVSGVNIKVKHQKPTQADPNGGIKRIEAPIHVSNVAHVDPTSGKPTRVGFKVDDKGRKVRFAKRSGENIDA
jgi:large subunit ribosomal protein L24